MRDDLASRLQALEDREAIRDLIARYGPLADSGEAGDLAQLWTSDGIYAVGGMGEAQGHTAIAGLIEGVVHQKLMQDGCAHVLSPIAIELDGDDAVAVGYSVVFRHDAGEFVVERVSANRWSLQRGPRGWQVHRRDNALLDGTAAARALLSLPAARRRR